ncbi:carbohydrate kinase family protein [Bacillus sp. 31A1R]|uniref:Carbohydrate kinase family protein n=1 Tax=Robertmurraya mangrovi TaxID=3098077 RepID=A0ABU5IWK3_9BACI|nr:carbohydrate kinase family protein [Bacillus sp. 31A1R]MDZ5471530.1 carbohydrate kinase family protein [Bacillus sp. 31A1R]
MKKVLVLGGVSYNLMVDVNDFPEPKAQTIHSVNSFFEGIGSTGAGKALTLSRLGYDVTLFATIGSDTYGKSIKDELEENHVHLEYSINPKGTTRHVNFMKKAGERLSIFLNADPDQAPFDFNKLEVSIAESDVIFLNIIPYCKEFIPYIVKYDKPVWVDLHDYNPESNYYDEFISVADVIQFSSENITDYKKVMLDLLDDGKEMVICTHGSLGSTTLLKDSIWIETPSFPYEVVDTNGAGDAFLVGLFHGLAEQQDVRTSLVIASVLGGLTVHSQKLFFEGLTKEYLDAELIKRDVL